MFRMFLCLGALSALVGVGAGSIGAHLLRDRIAPDLLAVYETGVRYQLVHALALLIVALLADHRPSPAWRPVGWLFVAGTVLFSGSLYLLSITGANGLGAITPLGGVCFLVAWILLVRAAVQTPS